MGLLRSSGRARRRRQQLRQAQMNGEGGGGSGDVTSNGEPAPPGDGFSPNTIKLIRKLVVYGVVFAAMRWAKGPPNAPSEEGGEDSVQPSIARRFLSGEDGLEVSVVDDFLPRDVATRWRRDMVREWSRVRNGRWKYATQIESSRKVVSDDLVGERNETVQNALRAGTGAYSGWELPPGDSHLAREISDAFAGSGDDGGLGLPERVRLAVSGGGSGAGDDPPKPAMDDEDAEFASETAAGTAGDGGHPLVLSSFAATHYATGDFRTLIDSSEVDDPSPSPVVFFFVSLAEGGWNDDRVGDGNDDDGVGTGKNETWRDEFGGEMQFQCGGPRDPLHEGKGNAKDDGASSSAAIDSCESVGPKFNRAVLFRVPSSHKIPRHEIRPVSWLAEEVGYRHLVLWGTYREGSKDETAGTATTDATTTTTPQRPRPRREGTEESIVGTDGEL